MKPIKIKYKTSLEKWRGIKKFAEINGLSTKEIDAMIKRIVKVGDASLEKSYTLEIVDDDGFFDAFYNCDEHPCPHCCKYTCITCPIDDYSRGCCEEWTSVVDKFTHNGNDINE